MHDYDYDVEPAQDSILCLDVESESQTRTSSPFRLSSQLEKINESAITSPQSKAANSKTVNRDTAEEESLANSQSSVNKNHPWEKDIDTIWYQLEKCLKEARVHISNAVATLDRQQWLCSDAIDERFQGILTSSCSDSCLLELRSWRRIKMSYPLPYCPPRVTHSKSHTFHSSFIIN